MRNNKFFITAIAVFLIIILPFMCAKAQDTTLVKYEAGYGGTVRTIDSIEAGSWRISTGSGAYWAKAEPKYDTIRVVMLVCDTTHYFRTWMEYKTCEEANCKDTASIHKLFVGHGVEMREDRGVPKEMPAYRIFGYSVREFAGYYNSNTTQNAIYLATPFYQHIEYLGEDKKPLINKIVWMAKEVGK